MVRGLFAASLGARGATAALMHDARGGTAAFWSNARGANFQSPAGLPERFRSFVSSSVREQVCSLLCRSGRSEVRRCKARVPCAPLEPLRPFAPAAAIFPAFSLDSRTALIFGSSRAMGGFTQWAGRQQKGGGDDRRAPRPGSRGGGSSRREPTPKGGGRQAPRGDDWSRGGGSSRREPTPRGRGRQAHHGKGGRRARSPAESLERKLVRALRHGEFGFRGSFERGGYLSHAALKETFQCSEELWQSALRRDRVGRKSRIDTRQPGFLRALQGHSTDCGHDLAFMAAPIGENTVADLRRSHGKYIYHGTDVHVVESIVAEGLLPGGGPGGRLANHFVVGPPPTQWSEARGFRRGSNAVVQMRFGRAA